MFSTLTCIMDFIEEILQDWGFEKYLPKFKDEEVITKESFEALTEDLIPELIRPVGPRALFIKKFKAYKAAQQTEREFPLRHTTSSPSSSLCSFNVLDEAVPNILLEDDEISEKREDVSTVSETRTDYADSEKQTQSESVDSGKRSQSDSSEKRTQSDSAGATEPTQSDSTVSERRTQSDAAGATKRLSADSGAGTSSKRVKTDDVKKLKDLLRQSATGELILDYAKTEQLPSKYRRKLSDIVLNEDLKGKPIKISSDRLIQLSEIIVAAFLLEIKSLYFVPYSVKGNVETTASGSLHVAYHALKREYRTLHKNQTDDVNSEDSAEESQEINEAFTWLKNAVDPWRKVEQYWKVTQDKRLEKLLTNANEEKFVASYTSNYKALQVPSGYTLLEVDFEYLYPDKAVTFLLEWPTFSRKVVELLRKAHLSNPCEATKLLRKKSENELNADVCPAVVLLALADLVEPVTVKSLSKTGPAWRPSRDEVQSGFCHYVKIPGEVDASILRRQDRFAILKQRLQPFVILLGPDIENITAAYVAMSDSLKYKLETPLRAVEVAFKSHFALHSSYSVESKPLWMLLQRVIYKIKTPYDLQSSNAAVKSLCAKFGVDISADLPQAAKRRSVKRK